MPRINIYEQDNTGSSPVEDLAIVFVPGEVAIAKNTDGISKADAYGCIYIPSTAEDLGDYFEDPNFNYSETGEKIDVRHIVQTLIGLNYGVIYMDVNAANAQDWVYTVDSEVTEETDFTENEYYVYSSITGEYTKATKWDVNATYFTRTLGEYHGWEALKGHSSAWDFLNDKNSYDIKFITTGNHYTVPVTTGASSIQGTTTYSFDFELANRALEIPTNRKDCALLLDLDYDAASAKANTLAADFKSALECTAENDLINALTKVRTEDDLSETCVSSRAYTAFSNCLMSYSGTNGTITLTVPGSFAYLYAYATVNNVATSWLPISGVTRGVIGDVFTPDIELSKYFLDTQIITDGAGVSFNGIVNVRSYGYTIWGDRTLIPQDAVRGVQATSYFSLRNLVSDIAKTAYNSAIRYTYETNNDVTWLNFKQAIVTLLDQMVSSGVLQTYKIGKIPSTDTERNKMKALIKIYPVLPVENFDVYINLENAEITTTADDVTA